MIGLSDSDHLLILFFHIGGCVCCWVFVSRGAVAGPMVLCWFLVSIAPRLLKLSIEGALFISARCDEKYQETEFDSSKRLDGESLETAIFFEFFFSSDFYRVDLAESKVYF